MVRLLLVRSVIRLKWPPETATIEDEGYE